MPPSWYHSNGPAATAAAGLAAANDSLALGVPASPALFLQLLSPPTADILPLLTSAS